MVRPLWQISAERPEGLWNMATSNKTPNNGKNASSNKPAPTPPAAKTETTNGAKAEDSGKAKKEKRPRVRWVSPKDPSFWVRSYKDVTDKHGAPKDPWGNAMEAKAAVAFGLTPEEREARKAAKEAEKARLDSMSPEEKLAFTQKRREERAAKRTAKKEAERLAMIEQIKKEIAEGKL